MISTHSISINGIAHQYSRLSILIPYVDLLGWLQEQELFPKFYWKGAEEVAALGEIAHWDTVPLIEGTSPLRLFGGISFCPGKRKDALWQEFPDCYFFLPAYELTLEGEQAQLALNFLDQPASDEGLRHLRFTHYSVQKEKKIHSARTDLPELSGWKTLLKKALSSYQFQKVVLARRATLSFSEPLKALSILDEIRGKANARVAFAFQPKKEVSFIGTTPERLYVRHGRELVCDAVAGTFLKGAQVEEEKLQRELSYVKTFISAILEKLCISFSQQEKDSVLSAYQIFHLYNRFSGNLHPHVTDADLVAALHPTPAISGFPQEEARQFIAKEEPFERGWYSAPIGWIREDSAEFAVAIRSALIRNKQMHLYSGAGIVEGSEAEMEWKELDQKIAHYLTSN
jgi:menaquinone-specific isochorismate synthase